MNTELRDCFSIAVVYEHGNFYAEIWERETGGIVHKTDSARSPLEARQLAEQWIQGECEEN